MKRLLRDYADTFTLGGVVVVVLVVFQLLNPNMLTAFNLTNILVQVSLTAIAATGMTFAMTAGVFDMSVGSIVALLSVVIARVGLAYGLPQALLAVLVVAILCGLINGLIVVKLKIQAFAATLVTMIIIRGAAILLAGGKEIAVFGMTSLKFAAAGTLLGIPVPIWLTAVAYVIAFFLYFKTSFGMKMRSVGSNKNASVTSGIKADRMLIAAFVCTAVTAAVSAVIMTGQIMFGKGTIAEDFAMDVITCVVLGGTLLSGGKGNLAGSLIASILITVIKTGLNIVGVNTFYQQLVIGVVFIGALVLNNLRSVRATKVERGAA